MASPTEPPTIAVQVGHFIGAHSAYDGYGNTYNEPSYDYGPPHRLPRPASGSSLHRLACHRCQALVQLSIDSLEILEAREQLVRQRMRRVIGVSAVAIVITTLWGVLSGPIAIVVGLIAAATTVGLLAFLRLRQPGRGWRMLPDDQTARGYPRHAIDDARPWLNQDGH